MTTLLFLVIAGIMTGCLKPPEITQDFGPEVNKALVEKAFTELRSASPYRIEVGEFAYMEKLQQVESNPADVIFQRGDTVTGKKEEPDHYVLTLVTEIRERMDGALKPSRKETEAILPKVKSIEQLALETTKNTAPTYLKLTKFEIPLAKSLKNIEEPALQRVTYHNLNIKTMILPTPDLVKKRSNCGGLSTAHCQNGIPSVELSFDKVIWTERGGDKSSFRFTVSEYSPFLASQLSACVQSKVDFQGQRVRVTQCEFIKDFTWGNRIDKIGSLKK